MGALTDRDRTLTQASLKEALHYDPGTGVWTWQKLSKMCFRTKVGDRAGGIYPLGYRVIGIGRFRYPEHILAFIYMLGIWPTEEVDHINCVRDDNRWCNLRLASRSENLCNRGASKRSSTGLKWVSVQKNKNGIPTYSAVVWKNHQRHYIGMYKTPMDAHLAAAKKAEELHGEFVSAGR